MFHHVSKITRLIIVAHASAITVYKCAVDFEMSSSSSPTMVPQISSYFEGLLEEDKRHYKSKIGLINGNDPFGKVVGGEPFSGVVPFDSCDLVSYLVLQTSFMTFEQFKARKSLEAYNQFVSGWIKDVSTMEIAGKYLTTGRVSLPTMHSNMLY